MPVLNRAERVEDVGQRLAGIASIGQVFSSVLETWAPGRSPVIIYAQ
jgi:hypothetical protein